MISLIDLEYQIIPDNISIPCTFIFAGFAYFILKIQAIVIFWGIISGGGMLYVITIIYYIFTKKQGVGGGDIKLMIMAGTMIGFKGVLFSIFTASLLGSITSLFIAFFARNRPLLLKKRVPFAPFLSTGIFIFIFKGDQLIKWYISLINASDSFWK